MGFDTFAAGLAADVWVKAAALASDFSSVIAILVAVAVFGLLLGIFARFVGR